MLAQTLRLSALCAAAIAIAPAPARAQPPAACRTIRLGHGGWLDNQVQNAVFGAVVAPFGYQVRIEPARLKTIYHRLADGRLDVYLQDWRPDNWMSSVTAIRDSDVARKRIAVAGTDLSGARHTLAVPAYLYRAGLKDFADIHKFAGQLDHTIYGIEPDNVGDRQLLSMIRHNTDGLGGFHLVQAGAGGMLRALAAKIRHHEPILFLGWQPDAMNVEYRIRYLGGGGAAFGHDQGAARSLILTRAGYAAQCPAIGGLLHRFRLPVRAESRMMYDIQVKREAVGPVAAAWIAAHPAWLKRMRAPLASPARG